MKSLPVSLRFSLTPLDLSQKTASASAITISGVVTGEKIVRPRIWFTYGPKSIRRRKTMKGRALTTISPRDLSRSSGSISLVIFLL